MTAYDSERTQWSWQTPITGVPNGTTFTRCNFTQESPWTEPFTATGLIFEDCNLTNVLLPSDATVIEAGNAKVPPELPDGRKIMVQHQYRITTESTEVDPGEWEDHEIQKRYRVTGTPTVPVETYQDEEDLGPTP